MDDIGQFLFLLAFVIIAAIQWVVKTIQDRRAPSEPEEDPLEETWRELEEHNENRQLTEEAEPPAYRREEPQRPVETSPINELRNLFESLKKPQAEPVPAPAQRHVAEVPVVAVAPQPRVAPVKERRVVLDPRANLSVAEKQALKNLKAAGNSENKRRRSDDGGFRRLLHGAGNIRQALILKEVFDRPVALREENIDDSFLQ